MVKKKAFSKLKRWQKRVAIAKDVIKQLDAKKFLAKQKVYVEIFKTKKAYKEGFDLFDNAFDQANCAIEEGKLGCTVCAKGAIFMSHIMKTNHCTVDQLNHNSDYDDIMRRLRTLFERKQLNLIECAFERSSRFYFNTEEDGAETLRTSETTKIAIKGSKFGRKYNTTDKRMRGIMKNIIKNKGEFKP